MDNLQSNQYTPDYLVYPGAVVGDYIDDLRMTQAELANRTGLTKKTINHIINGKAPITPETAIKFEFIFGRPAHFWSNLERQYQEVRIRLREQDLI